MGFGQRPNQNTLLERWEEVYKRGLLSFWLLMVLQKERSYAYEIPDVIEEMSQGSITVNGNSIYRSLRRFEEDGLVKSEVESSPEGPPRRYYRITRDGLSLLQEFIRRNVLVFSSAPVDEYIQQALDEFEVAETQQRKAP